MSKQAEPKKKISRAVFENAEPHVDGKTTRIIWDSRLAGFGLRVRPTGAKSFVYVYRSGGKPKWVTIKATSADDAFDQATEMANLYHRGKDPVAEREDLQREADRRGQAFTVGDVLGSFVEQHAKAQLKEKTWTEYERIVEKVLKPEIGKIKIDALDTHDVATLYERLKKRPRSGVAKKGRDSKPQPLALTQAAGAIRVLSSAMRWAIEDAKLRAGPNPAQIRLKATRQRDRLLTDNEVSRLIAATDQLESDGSILPHVALAIRLLFATGCRAGEVCNLRWDEIDPDWRFIRWSDTKTGYLRKAITNETRELLESAPRIVGSPWVCPATDASLPLRVDVLRSGFRRVMKRAEVIAGENASLHLIRHWFATQVYNDNSLTLPQQKRIVGHTSIAAAMRYAHLNDDEWATNAENTSEKRLAKIKAASRNGEVVSMAGTKK
ncbi:tyrosine-type recombinase/integrase [Agrobacterium sp. MCAB5]|uniref:tyrosine-type recombinase/integrase n=1 Tax=Agrobacterium sp. MCAB5 TaxID=3233042 RepID=UPI003F8FA27B